MCSSMPKGAHRMYISINMGLEGLNFLSIKVYSAPKNTHCYNQ